MLEHSVLPTPHKICEFSLTESEDKDDEAVMDAGSSKDREDKEDDNTDEE